MAHIIGENLPNIPWQEPTTDAPLWRYDGNPIIKRNPIENVTRVFNSAVVPFKGGFAGVFRAETNNGIPYLYFGKSADGINFTFSKERIVFHTKDGGAYKFEYAYDPRVVKIEDAYYVIWCDGQHGQPVLALGKTKDFETFEFVSRPFLPFNRNGVLFPKRINGKYYLLSRPSDNGHTPFGDIYISESPDLVYWGNHSLLMERGYECWQGLKIGAGCAPIETSEGWLVFYHGATMTCNGYVYSIGAAILDREDPRKVKYRCGNFVLTPETDYETIGFVPNVTFPCAALADAATGRIAIYYGAADTVVGLAFTTIDKIVDYIVKFKR